MIQMGLRHTFEIKSTYSYTKTHTHINSYTHSFTWTEAYTRTQTCLRAQQVIVVWTVWERRAEKRGCNWRSVSLLCGCFQSISKLLTSPAVPQLIASNDLIATHVHTPTHTHSQLVHGPVLEGNVAHTHTFTSGTCKGKLSWANWWP